MNSILCFSKSIFDYGSFNFTITRVSKSFPHSSIPTDAVASVDHLHESGMLVTAGKLTWAHYCQPNLWVICSVILSFISCGFAYM